MQDHCDDLLDPRYRIWTTLEFQAWVKGAVKHSSYADNFRGLASVQVTWRVLLLQAERLAERIAQEPETPESGDYCSAEANPQRLFVGARTRSEDAALS